MWRGLVVVLCLSLVGGVACKTSKPYGGGTTAGASFSGRVTDPKKQPIANARIDVNGFEARSESDGSFRLTVPGALQYLLNISHRDYAGVSYVSRTGLSGQRWILVPAQSETVDPTGTITLVDRRPGLAVGGATLTLSPNTLVDPRGNPPAGSVRASIATLDVSNGEGPTNWAVRSDDGRREGFLVSYGAVYVQFTDASGGVMYQIRRGQTAQLVLPVLPNMTTHAPANPDARFWYYDERDGYWKRTGEARFDPGKGAYVGTVNHLSFLNTDIAKFDAACLKMTLDASVPPGNKIRIRYHSGGTPFGQTPTFVLADTDNAAYRLPANTNVLLELFDAADEPFGNLVVEDPPGAPLVNTVVNTGPAIPMGGDLWPPPPYAPCHPVVLKLATPQVEIRINELPADVFPRDNPGDDYLTWAPTFARARLNPPMMADVNVVLTNDPAGAIPFGGDVNFAAYVTPWPVNTTATATTLSLALPADGSWVPFVVAGKFGTPSRNDKDTIVEAHDTTAMGPLLGTKAMMVRVRKNANTLSPEERARFLFAWRKFRNKVGENYIQFQEMHRLSSMAGDESHMQPSFLPWHRAMLLHVERELQKLEPSVALHYWDWDAAAPNVFNGNFMGANGAGGFTKLPVFSLGNPLIGWDTDLALLASGELRRSTTNHTLPPVGMTPTATMTAAWPNYGPATHYGPPGFDYSVNSFSDAVERESHNNAHGWPCTGGQLYDPNRSAADPLFYLLHSNVDRQWAHWQRVQNRHGVAGMTLTFPAPQHYDNACTWNTCGNISDPDFRQKGSFLNDGLWPWDGTSDGPAGTASTRPPNVAGGPLDTSDAENIPTSTPTVPMTSFPASVRRNLWPSIATIPTNAHMIDYLGKFLPQDGLGMCYDNIQY